MQNPNQKNIVWVGRVVTLTIKSLKGKNITCLKLSTFVNSLLDRARALKPSKEITLYNNVSVLY